MDDLIVIKPDDGQEVFEPVTVEVSVSDGSRESKIRRSFTKKSKLIEIGASHAPLLPKADGWNTTVVDHATRDVLIQKYKDETELVNRVEEVDYVWSEGDISDIFPVKEHGTFDGIVASHVGEHIPDFLRFLQAADKLISPTGAISLALPDKRYCFDFFQPHTTTGDILAAYSQKRIRHERKTFFNQAAYMVYDRDYAGWNIGSHPELRLMHSLESAVAGFNNTDKKEYVDSHTWYFTPASLKLIVLELRYLGLINWKVDIVRALGVEFYAWFTRQSFDRSIDINKERMSLLKEMILERQEEVDLVSDKVSPPITIEKEIVEITDSNSPNQIEEIPTEIIVENPPNKELTISAIIPVYNGEKYLEEAIYSVLTQSVPVKELIIVDDGSVDSSSEIIHRIIAENPDRNIQYIHQDNAGQSSARNNGISKSTGDLIALLDQDDAWYRNHLEVLIQPFYEEKGRELGWVYSNLDEINEHGFMVTRSFLSTIGTTHPKEDIFTCLREDLFILPSAALISRKAFDKVGGFDIRLSGYEDDDLFLRIFQAGYHNIYLNTPLSKWRIHSASASYSYRMARSRSIFMRKLFDQFPDDVVRSRYYRRDLIAPRFRPHLVVDYLAAVRSGEQDKINTTANELRYVMSYGGAKGRALQLMLAVTKYPWLARTAYKVRKPFRKAILRRLGR